jgi:uncharacterized protein involved in exopolysaccharide biosynthesis
VITKVKQNFERNLAKFQLYSIRNVFNSSASDTASSSSIVTQSPASKSSSSSQVPDTEEVELDKTLLRLRNNYTRLQRDYLQISTECRDMDTLLKDMRSAMFNLKVALQSLEDLEINSLSETTYIISDYQLRLKQRCNDAEGWCLFSLSSCALILCYSYSFFFSSLCYVFLRITAEN